MKAWITSLIVSAAMCATVMALPSSVHAGDEGETAAVSYTHLTLPTKA